MKRRDFFKSVIGAAAAAVVLPEVVKAVPAIPAGTPLTEIAPDGMWAIISPSTGRVKAYVNGDGKGPVTLDFAPDDLVPTDCIVGPFYK